MKFIRLVSYKASGEPHRLWQRLRLAEENEDYYIFICFFPLIVETNGRSWSNREPTIYYCHKKRFFNVLVMMKESKQLAYYVNIASPTVQINDITYGFTDYDLDVKLLADKTIKVVDEEEFIENTKSFNYSSDLIKISRWTVEEIQELMKEGKTPFDDDENYRLFEEHKG